MAKRITRTRNGGTMTEAQFFGKIRSLLRRGFMYWTPMKMALELRKRKSQSSNKRLLWEYSCEQCVKWFPRKNIQIDHKDACGTLLHLDDLPDFVSKLTQENVSAYQILCKKCHQLKTNQERKKRTCQT